MKAPIKNRPANVTEAEEARVSIELVQRITAEASDLAFGAMVAVDHVKTTWIKERDWSFPGEEEKLHLRAAVTIYDETGTARCLVATGTASMPVSNGGKWFLTWSLRKAGSCLA